MTGPVRLARNFKIIVSYDGTDYHGWQVQPGKRTIQGTIEETLAKIARKKIPVAGAGRTDAGVHARGQTAHFKAALTMTAGELFRALNALLPGDIRIDSLDEVPLDFHARRDAKGKVYQYRIWRAREIDPFVVRYALHWPYPLDLARMRQAARLFQRKGDFSGLSSNRLLQPVREITRSELRMRGNEILFTVEARGFLRYMVRTMAGTLLEVGRGRLAPADIEEIFRNKKRTLASPTAPAKGLCLLKVLY